MGIDLRKSKQKNKLKPYLMFTPVKTSRGGKSERVFAYREQPTGKIEDKGYENVIIYKYHYVAIRNSSKISRSNQIQLVMRYNNRIIEHVWFQDWNEMCRYAYTKHLQLRDKDFTSSV